MSLFGNSQKSSGTDSQRTAVFALLVSFAACIFAGWQGCATQKSLNRATGLDAAKLEIVDYIPANDDIAPAFKAKLFSWDAVRFQDLDRLLAFHPRLIVRNAGEEPIEILRTTVSFSGGLIDARGLATDVQHEKNPWVLKQVEQEDHVLKKRLERGQFAVIPLEKGLVGQMMQAQDEKKGDRDHYGTFQVKCYAKLFGASNFDDAQNEAQIVLMYGWIPKGFPGEKCRSFLSEYRPDVLILPNLRDAKK